MAPNPRPPFELEDRIELVLMGDDPDPIPPGARGTVLDCTWLESAWQVHVRWDSGRTLSLIVPPDVARKVAP
jgi:hypothetical protein